MWLDIGLLLAMDEGARQRLIQLLERIQGDRTQRKFAGDLGVGLGTLQNWLRGGIPSAKNLEKIAAAAGMSIEELFNELRGEEAVNAPKVAEEVLLLVLQLDDEEQRRLMKLLIDRIGRN